MSTPTDAAGSVVIVGGTSGIGREIAAHYAEKGRDVVLTGRDAGRAKAVAAEVGGSTEGVALELSEPAGIGPALAGLGPIEHLVLAAIDRDRNTAAEYDLASALHLVTLKLVGYTEVVHALLPRISRHGSVVLFGGQARERPYPGSVTVSTINGGVVGLVHSLAVELAPIRVNALHPGIVGDSPEWRGKPAEVLDGVRKRTPTGQLVAMADIVHATDFLLSNRSMNGANLVVDGGWLLL